MGNRFSFLPLLLLLVPLALIFSFLLSFVSFDLGLIASAAANQEHGFWNYVGSTKGMNYNDLLLSIDTQTDGGVGGVGGEGGMEEEEGLLPPINNSNTFYTKGLLSTVLFPDNRQINQNLSGSSSTSPTSLNQTSESIVFHNFQKLVSGTWSLNVSRGLVTDFNANFKLLTVNGIDKHFIEILNFQNSNDSSVTFNQFSNTPINGFADIKIDNEIFQSKFPLTIQIFKINTIVLTIKDKTVSDIFYNNNLLGITDSFKNFKGDELLIFEEDEK